MKKIKEMLDAVVEPINLASSSSFSNFLTEESDFDDSELITEEDDPFAGGDSGNDAGGDAGGGDPFASNGNEGGGDGGDAGGDPFAGGDGNDGGDGADGQDAADADDDKDDEESVLTDGSHKPDPEFNQGESDQNDVTLSKSPAISNRFNITDIMKTVTSVIQSLGEEQLIEIEKIKNNVELIFNGFLLNEDDLEFENTDNAIFLIDKIASKLDIKEKSYLLRKMKEPLIKKRDAIKQDIAAKRGELNDTRDILTKLDTKV